MAHNPLDQFKVKEIVNIQIGGYDVSITNSSLFMLIVGMFIVCYFMLAFKSKSLVPSRIQLTGELAYEMITGMLDQSVGAKGRKFVY